MFRSKTTLIVAAIIMITAAFGYLLWLSLSQSQPSLPDGPTGKESYPAHTEVYGLSEGDIVKLDLESTEGDTKPFYSANSDIVDAVMTENYTAYVTDNEGFFKLDTANPENVEALSFQPPSYFTLTALKGDSILYGIPRAEPVEEEASHDESEDSLKAEAHDIYFSQIDILSLADSTAEPKTLTLPEGSEVKADLFAVSPDRETFVVSAISGNLYLYDNKGQFMKDLNQNVSKVGFLNNDTLWFSGSLDDPESTDQHIKLLNIDSGEVSNLYEKNDKFSQLSLLSFVQVGSKYILLGNSYKTGTPLQTVFMSDRNFEELEGIVTLSSLSLNSNGKVFPIPDSQYLIDVRASSNSGETATFKLSTNGEDATIYGGVSELFSPPIRQ